LLAGDQAREDAADVCVQDGVAFAVGEDRYGCCCVRAYSREGQEGVSGCRELARVLFRHDRGGFVEAEGAAGVAQAAPLADRFAGRVGG
jgi:hypothetical protein